MPRPLTVVLLIIVVCTLTGCLAGANPLAGQAAVEASPAGFLLGLWHGFTVLFAFIVSLFSDSIGVYEVHNSGWPYNLGYLLGIMMFFGGSGAGSRGRR